MLFSNFRAQVLNESGIQPTDVTVQRRFWYIDPSTGRPAYSAWGTVISGATPLDGGVANQGTPDDNTSSGYLGAEYRMSVSASSAGSGVITLLLQNQDGSSAFPSDGNGISIGGLEPINGTVSDDFTA